MAASSAVPEPGAAAAPVTLELELSSRSGRPWRTGATTWRGDGDAEPLKRGDALDRPTAAAAAAAAARTMLALPPAMSPPSTDAATDRPAPKGGGDAEAAAEAGEPATAAASPRGFHVRHESAAAEEEEDEEEGRTPIAWSRRSARDRWARDETEGGES